MNDSQAVAAIAVMAVITAALRIFPFLIFRGGRTPAVVTYLGRVLPYSIMGMLVVYCLRDTNIHQPGSYVPYIISCAVVVLSYIWKRNSLLSIVGGTACYMILVQAVF